VTCRFGEFDFAGVFQTAVQENPLRRRITWVRVGTDRFNAEGPVAVIDDGGNGFTSIPVAPIGLAQPIAERRFFTIIWPDGAPVEAGPCKKRTPRRLPRMQTRSCRSRCHAALSYENIESMISAG
jgi:hypothetical protein